MEKGKGWNTGKDFRGGWHGSITWLWCKIKNIYLIIYQVVQLCCTTMLYHFLYFIFYTKKLNTYTKISKSTKKIDITILVCATTKKKKKKSTRWTKILKSNKNNYGNANLDIYSTTEMWNKNQQLQRKKLINLKISWEILKHLLRNWEIEEQRLRN